MRRSRFAAWALLPVLAGCAAAAVAGASPPVEETPFAPSLQVALGEMERTATGIYLQDTREGSGDEVRRGSRVAVHFAGWLADGTQIDARVPPAEPVEFTVGAGEVIRGWDEGVVSMREGGQRRLVIPARLAYGARGRGPIPGGAHLVFLIEVAEVR